MSNNETPFEDAASLIVAKAVRRFRTFEAEVHQKTDRVFVRLLLSEWAFCIAIACFLSPFAWQGKTRVLHAHVWAAVLLGGLLCSLPALLAWTQAGRPVTRHVVAVAQMLMSALLIHLTGGRIETHFHVFGSLAFLAFYLDWRVLVTVTVTIGAEHFLRGMLWPESIYGITNPEWWRFLEHAGWVVFCVGFLARHCVVTLRSWLRFAEEGGMLEALAESEWRERSVLEREHPKAPGAAE